MITDEKLKRYINDQVRFSLLVMHEDGIVYVSNGSEGDMIIDKAYHSLLGEFGNDNVPTTQDVNQAITRAYLEMYPVTSEEEEVEEESRFNLKPEDFAEMRK